MTLDDLELHRFSFPTAITFGPGARQLLVEDLRAHELHRPLVVTDKGVGALPIFVDLVANLAAGGLEPEPFDGVWGNPVKSQVEAGVAAFQAHGADSIVGIGGGAALDVAKAVALMATHPGDLFEYEDEMPGARPIGPVPHLVAIPTTAGTGSEVGRSAVISDDVTHVKRIIFSPHLLADSVLADPELTIDLPAAITAATGMDALTHNIEAYLAKAWHPICDGIALEGLRLGAANLARAVAHPHDLGARGAMLMSSMMGAIAFQKGLGLVHSTAHALGTVADLHHGLANAVMIDHALTFNVEVAGPTVRGDGPGGRAGRPHARGVPALAGRPQGRDRDAPLADRHGREARRPRAAERRGLRGLVPPQQPAAGRPGRLPPHLPRGLRMSTRTALRVGVSACFFHADPERPVFKGKTLLYAEESMLDLVGRAGALALMLPRPVTDVPSSRPRIADYVDLLDGLLLQGGSDVCPRSYGEEPLRPQWEGDEVRDRYEIELIHAFHDVGKPVLGICRGIQILNVAFGGSLYQDIATQVPGSADHRNWDIYDANRHEIDLVAGSRLADLYGGADRVTVNSVHHQAVRELADGVRGRGDVDHRRHRRGDAPARRAVRGRRAVAPRVHAPR